MLRSTQQNKNNNSEHSTQKKRAAKSGSWNVNNKRRPTSFLTKLTRQKK